MPSLKVTIPPDLYVRLEAMAARELRPVRNQAEWLLLQLLREAINQDRLTDTDAPAAWPRLSNEEGGLHV